MGKVPMPVCAPKVVANDAHMPCDKCSTTMAEVTLSSPIPSYDSGMSILSRPNSPHSRISCSDSSLLNFSISCLLGLIRSLANCSTVFAISCCSSENCSLVKISSEQIGEVKKDPPVFILSPHY